MSLPCFVAPSILSADPVNLEREIKGVEAAGADLHHIDVMDGHFVPNLTFGLPLIKRLKEIVARPLDVHIMVSNPDDVALSYVEAGADILSFHIEAAKHPHRIIEQIAEAGCKPAVAINPGTALELLWPVVGKIAQINVMSVNPGFGGQKFIPEAVDRVSAIYQHLRQKGLHETVRIEVDGGINAETANQVVRVGASVLVAGHFIYGAADRKHSIQTLKQTGMTA